MYFIQLLTYMMFVWMINTYRWIFYICVLTYKVNNQIFYIPFR